MKPSLAVLAISAILVLLFLGLRTAWYYPCHRRPPVLTISQPIPVQMDTLHLVSGATSTLRYQIVVGDKRASFPDGDSANWSGWYQESEVDFPQRLAWIKLFTEEKWWLYRKRSALLFFQAAGKEQMFRDLLSENPEPAILTAGKPEVLFVGDSLTVGLFASTEQHGFARLVQERVGRPDQADIRASRGVALTKTDAAMLMEGIRLDLDLIILELGTNDYEETTLAEFIGDYGRLLRRIRRRFPAAQILCLGIWRGYPGVEFDWEIRRIARQHGAGFLYLGDIFEDQENHAAPGRKTPWGESDDFHPGDQGHKAIAERIIAAVRGE